MEKILGTVDGVKATVGVHHHVVLVRAPPTKGPLFDYCPPRFRAGQLIGVWIEIRRDELRDGAVVLVGLDQDRRELLTQRPTDHRAPGAHQADQLLPLVVGPLATRRPVALLMAVRALLLELRAFGGIVDPLQHPVVPDVRRQLIGDVDRIGRALEHEI